MADNQKAALDQIKAVYEDGEAEINGRVYVIGKTTHKQRRPVFAYFSSIQKSLQAGDFSFIDTPEFERIETGIGKVVTFEGSAINNIPSHWDEYPEDYLLYIQTMLAVLSYPFMRGKGGG